MQSVLSLKSLRNAKLLVAHEAAFRKWTAQPAEDQLVIRKQKRYEAMYSHSNGICVDQPGFRSAGRFKI